MDFYQRAVRAKVWREENKRQKELAESFADAFSDALENGKLSFGDLMEAQESNGEPT